MEKRKEARLDTKLNVTLRSDTNIRKDIKKDYERRQHKRFIERCKVEFTVNNQTYRGLSGNFSLNGLFIRTRHLFQTETLLNITIHLPNDMSCRLKGKVMRVSQDIPWGSSEADRGYRERGMGIEIIEKDSLYLYFIRSLLSPRRKDLLEHLVFSAQESQCQKIRSELQNTCQLFDIVAFFIGEKSNQGDLSGKIWFEAKIKNNTNYTFEEPVIVFMTGKNNQHPINLQGENFPVAGTMMMSSAAGIFWKPNETIPFMGEVDLSSEEMLNYESKFIDYIREIRELVPEEPIHLDEYISTLWIASPQLAISAR
jgi:hypothetical protein